MTAILGFNCADGVLMLADTEEWTSEGTKSECEKIARFVSQNGGVFLVGGAGDSHFIEYETQRLTDTVQTFTSWKELYEVLNKEAKTFVKQNLAPYRGLSQEPSGIALLIAAYYQNETALFRWQHDAVSLLPPFSGASVGCGFIQTHPMLQDVKDSRLTCTATLIHGVRIMLHTKRIVRDVGGKTEAMAVYKNGGTQWYGDDTMLHLQNLAAQIEKFHCTGLLPYISSDILSDKDEQHFLGQITLAAREFREEYQRIVKPLAGGKSRSVL
ncbi:MAG: hypothetical protein WAN10_08895 [Candidatus Acidiferrales bacterium]